MISSRLLFAVAIFGVVAGAQEFEVASIKPTASVDGRTLAQDTPGRLVLRNFTARGLILFAYGVADYQVSGGPSWISSDSYDLQATTESKATVQQMEGPMLRTLLENRFRLTLHRETRQLPVYELTLASGAAKLQPSKSGTCIVRSPNAPPPGAGPGTIFCGAPRTKSNGLSRTLDETAASITGLAGYLSRWQLRRPIIDKTGLTGTFDIHLEWAADPPNGVGDPDSSGPSIFTALREQLGLKLESGTGPVEVLVIDHIEKPSPN